MNATPTWQTCLREHRARPLSLAGGWRPGWVPTSLSPPCGVSTLRAAPGLWGHCRWHAGAGESPASESRVITNTDVNVRRNEKCAHDGNTGFQVRTPPAVLKSAASRWAPEHHGTGHAHLLDLLRGNRLILGIDGSFGHNDDVQPFLPGAVLGDRERVSFEETPSRVLTRDGPGALAPHALGWLQLELHYVGTLCL